MLRLRARDRDLSSAGRGGAQVGGRLDAVRQDGVFHIVPGAFARNSDDALSPALDQGARLPQKRLQVRDLRLPGGVDEPGDPGTGRGGEDGVFRGAYTGEAEDDVSAPQVPGLAQDIAPLLPDGDAQLPQGGKVQVDGPLADLAAAGQAQPRPAAPGQNRPQENHRGTHLPHELMGDIPPVHHRGIHQYGVALPADLAAQMLQDLDGRAHVPQVGAVM